MPAGQPPYYKTAYELQLAIDAYFDGPGCDFTITGLALDCGFISRQSFYDYEEREEFSYIIKKARSRVERAYEQKLSSKDVGGAIFALKNMGWKDKQEIDQTIHGEPIQLIFPDALPMETDKDG